MHSGVRETLTRLYEGYWSLRGCQAVHQALKSCVTCRKFQGIVYSVISFSNSPETRMSDDSPFTHTGFDFVGLLVFHLKNCGKEQEAKEEKACMFVYVCVNTRDISSTHTWYGSGKIFDGTQRICQSQRAIYLPLSVMIMQNFRSIPWTDGKDLPTCINFMLPYRQSDQLDFHISKGSLVE